MFGVHFTYDEPEQIEQEDFDSSKLDNLEKSVWNVKGTKTLTFLEAQK